MKKKFYYAAMFAAGLMTISTSCSNEDEIINEGENSEVATGEQVIVLDMQDTDVLSTKSRPLYSTENKGAENVTDVKLMIFEHQVGTQMKLSQVISIPNWNQISTEYDYGNKLTIKLGTDYGSEKLQTDKTYTIYAVGQDATTQTPAPFTVNSGNTIADLAIGKGLTENMTWNGDTEVGKGFVTTDGISYEDAAANINKPQAVSEIYSGISQPVEIKLDGGFSASVLLKRQVAGVLGYFNRIPAWVKNAKDNGHKSVRYIRLIASNRNTSVDLTNKMGVQTDDATGSSNVESIVNGFSVTEGVNNSMDAKYKGSSVNDAYTIYEIDLSKWFTHSLGDDDFDGSTEYWANNGNTSYDVDWKDNYGTDVPMLGINTSAWYNPYNPANTGKGSVIVEENSVLAGEFVIPFEKNPQSKTFELQLLDSTKTEVLKAWDVNLDEMSRTDVDQEKFYNIYRNHLYQIGKRGDGDDPDNPGTDPDKPQPLDKDQELTIKINDQWEFIHDLEID